MYDVVDPPDFEEVVEQQRYIMDRDPIRHLLEYPDDDLEVRLVPRKCRTIAPIVPEHG